MEIRGTIFHLKVIDVNLMVESPKIELQKVWPSLEDKLRTEVESNLVCGTVDMIIGIDTLYSKAKYNSAFNHPELGLQMASTLFGNTLGGILDTREDNIDHPIKLRALTTLLVDNKKTRRRWQLRTVSRTRTNDTISRRYEIL